MATVFRPPIIVTISPRRKVAEDWSVNVRVLYAPNPAVPFSQLDWPLAVRAKAKATGEPIAALSPLYNPTPVNPFSQSDWLNATRGRPPQKSDAPTYTSTFYVTAKPFTEPSWPSVLRGRAAAKVDDVVNLVPLQNPVVVVAAPFSQSDWPLAAARRKPVPIDTVQLLLPLTIMPFAGLTETRIFARQAVRSDIFVNLLPLQAAPVIFPFSLTDWSTVARRRPAALVDLIERDAPLYTPNPDRPFIDPIMMNSNSPKRAAAIVDTVANLLPPQNPPPPVGHVFEWLTRARRRGRR